MSIQSLLSQYSNLQTETQILESLREELKLFTPVFTPDNPSPVEAFERFIEALKVTDCVTDCKSQFGYVIFTDESSHEEVRAALIKECEEIIKRVEAHRALLMSAIRAATC
jgi:hypothetical protein